MVKLRLSDSTNSTKSTSNAPGDSKADNISKRPKINLAKNSPNTRDTKSKATSNNVPETIAESLKRYRSSLAKFLNLPNGLSLSSVATIFFKKNFSILKKRPQQFSLFLVGKTTLQFQSALKTIGFKSRRTRLRRQPLPQKRRSLDWNDFKSGRRRERSHAANRRQVPPMTRFPPSFSLPRGAPPPSAKVATSSNLLKQGIAFLVVGKNASHDLGEAAEELPKALARTVNGNVNVF